MCIKQDSLLISIADATCRNHRQVLTEICRDFSESRTACYTLFLTYVKPQLRTQNSLRQKKGFNPGKVESGHVIYFKYIINLVLQASGAAWGPFIRAPKA